MSPEIIAETPATPPHSEFECACPPSHRRLRVTLSIIVGLLVAAIIACLIYLVATGGFKP